MNNMLGDNCESFPGTVKCVYFYQIIQHVSSLFVNTNPLLQMKAICVLAFNTSTN